MKATILKTVPTPCANDALAPSHEEIAVEAEVLWRQKGCPENCDEEIWLEAERQLLHVARTYREELDDKALAAQCLPAIRNAPRRAVTDEPRHRPILGEQSQ
ncbi:MAG: DUF2934 domain-containing protein [Opitutaceae bacterium]